MSASRLLFIFTLFLATTGCAPLPAKYDFDTDIDFTQYQRYQWQNSSHSVDPISDTSLLEKRVHAITNRILTGRAIELNRQRADFSLTYHIVTHERLDVRDYGAGFYWPYHRGPMTDIYQYTEGTLIIDMIDLKTEKLIWRGWATQAIEQPSIPQKQLERILKQIFDNFPL